MPRTEEEEVIDLLNGYHMHDGLVPHKHLSSSNSIPYAGMKVLVLHPPANVHEQPGWLEGMNELRRLQPYTVAFRTGGDIIRLRECLYDFALKASWLCHELPLYLNRPPQVGDHVWLPHKPANEAVPITWIPEMNECIGGMYEVAEVDNGIVRVRTIPNGQEFEWIFWYEWFAKLPPSLQQYAEEENDEEQRTTINNVTIIKTPHWIGFIRPQKRFYQQFFNEIKDHRIIDIENNQLHIFSCNDGEQVLKRWKQYSNLLMKYNGKKIKDVLCKVTAKHIKLRGRWKKSIAEAEEASLIKTLDREKVWFGSDGNERLTYYYKADVYVEHENEQKIPELIRRYRYEVA